ncbi:cysteine desulfurase [Oryzihumus leptocrescens]|uniref:Cysteine desulfurase n=1 Tax=Oryzihumus leptocrescens TaxID=297536 RepID=A0A542ZJV5_9MICO|nr:aminotransferase class V-fold PLP-dependent enzyme [Oryzihumus leptocrescens]TQL60579.1 cysteine desulfurase [Oryzihumus leptocrescens]
MAQHDSRPRSGASSAAPTRGFLDAARAPMVPAAREALLAALDVGWADPRRLHAEGRRARAVLDQAREELAAGLGVRPPEVSFLPDGPAALRAAVGGLAHAGRRRGQRVVATAVEHSAVLLEGRYAVAQSGEPDRFAEVPVDHLGRVDPSALESALDGPGTVAAVVQAANGEVGTRQPLAAAHAACRARGIPLVVDAMAGLGRDPVPADFDVLAGEALSWGGPPGVGVLVVPERVRWRRPGPVSELEGGRTDVQPVVPLALAAAEAWRQTAAVREADAAASRELVDRVRAAAAAVPDVEVVGDRVDRLPHVVTFSCLYVDGEALVTELDRRGFAVASGSACTASTLEPSHVLAAMGVLTHGNVRVTLPLEAVTPDRAAVVDRFCGDLCDAVATVRAQLGVQGL